MVSWCLAKVSAVSFLDYLRAENLQAISSALEALPSSVSLFKEVVFPGLFGEDQSGRIRD